MKVERPKAVVELDEDAYYLCGRLSAEYLHGDVGAFARFRTLEASYERCKMHRGYQRARFTSFYTLRVSLTRVPGLCRR